MIAEVQLNNTEEFGVEFGLQSPVLFNRGAADRRRASTSTRTAAAAEASTRPNAGIVGFQGLRNLGVGRVGTTQGFGGFVFSASSDTFNLLDPGAEGPGPRRHPEPAAGAGDRQPDRLRPGRPGLPVPRPT